MPRGAPLLPLLRLLPCPLLHHHSSDSFKLFGPSFWKGFSRHFFHSHCCSVLFSCAVPTSRGSIISMASLSQHKRRDFFHVLYSSELDLRFSCVTLPPELHHPGNCWKYWIIKDSPEHLLSVHPSLLLAVNQCLSICSSIWDSFEPF